MSLEKKLPNSILGLKGQKPQNFGVNPIPPNSLHNLYSVDGNPDVSWRPSNGSGFKPLPSTMDELDPIAPNLQVTGVVTQIYKSKTGRTYSDLGPEGGRY
jgi:hypothetical protein